MNKGILAAGAIMLAVMALAVVNIINNYSAGNELTESLLRDTVEGAMLDAVDIGYYRVSGGVIRMDTAKFLENFTRRFAESVSNDKDYTIRVYDVYEIPPKVTVQVGSKTTATFQGEEFDIVNRVSGILETKYSENQLIQEKLEKEQ